MKLLKLISSAFRYYRPPYAVMNALTYIKCLLKSSKFVDPLQTGHHDNLLFNLVILLTFFCGVHVAGKLAVAKHSIAQTTFV